MTSNPAPSARTALQPWLVALGLWLALTAVASITLWRLRSDALDTQKRELGLLSLALTDEVDRGLQGAEAGLHALRIELRDGRLPLSGPQAEQALRTRADLMPLVQSLWLADRSGRLLSASDATPLPELASFAPALDALADGTIALSRPFIDTITNQSLLAIAVRAEEASGTSWIVAAMPAAALLGAFTAATPAADARMAVFRSDGELLAGELVTRPAPDESIIAERLASLHSMEVIKSGDGSQRLVGLHSLERYGINIVLSRDLGAVLDAWRQTAQVTAAAMVLLLVLTAMSVTLVVRADQRHAEAQRALQTQLSRASKLESLGTLAGGVAHDFNNVLAGIVGFAEMAQDTAPMGSDQARHLDRVLQAALRGKALVERILAFSRGGARETSVFDLAPVVEEVLSLLAASLRPGVILERGLAAHGALVRGDPTQAFEAVMNLCTNAMQAMPEGGMLSVQLERRHVTALQVLSHSRLAPGDVVALTVSDQGCGITAEVMERLFEPFFTTRRKQAGTGLGLAVVHGVVAEFGGAIDVRSTAGQGASFTLYFPEFKGEAASAAVAPAISAPVGKGQRLIVVDDEPLLVTLAQEMLQGLGYEPVGFTDSAAALQALRAAPRRFSALITDEVMPGLTGTQLTQALRGFAPQLPVLLISGYGGALLAARATAAGVTRVLTKPLQRADLARVLAELLQ